MKHLLPFALLLTACSFSSTTISSFEECVQAGNPVMESYPEQCTTKDGRLFTNTAQKPPVPSQHELIEITSPEPGEVVSNTIEFSGRARGQWYFEASFSVELLDAEERVLGYSYATAQGDWMTTEFVPFTGSIEIQSYPDDLTDGFLVFKKANASGLPEYEDEVRVPVRFE